MDSTSGSRETSSGASSLPDDRPDALPDDPLIRNWLRAGVQVSASASEASSETDMVTARARKNVPVTPVMEISGRKTTIGVMVEPIRGMVISPRALWIACSRVWPASRCSTMFSTTTIASSMTKPTAAASPPSVIRLKLSPINLRAINVTAMVTGITRPATMEVPQSRRKITRMIEARMSPMMMASRTLAIDSETISD